MCVHGERGEGGAARGAPHQSGPIHPADHFLSAATIILKPATKLIH